LQVVLGDARIEGSSARPTRLNGFAIERHPVTNAVRNSFTMGEDGFYR
jgi:hypothetical protein